MKPDELLDLELWQYNACAEGAADRQRDQVATAIQGAYYSAYWNNTKRAKKLHQVIEQIYKDPDEAKPDVDVEKFEERVRRFEQYGGLKKTNQNS